MARLFPGGRLHRFSVDFYEATPRGKVWPVMTAIADGECQIFHGRRIVYHGRGRRKELVLLGPDLKDTGRSEPLNPPVPAGADPGGVTVALFDSGINYTIPALAARLLEAHPDWRAPELKRAILAQARPSPDRQLPVVRYGWIPNPEYDR